MDPSQLSPSARQVFHLIEFDDEERLLFEVRKHWFGLFIIYFIGTLVSAIILAIVLTLGLANTSSLGTELEALRLPVLMIGLLLVVFSTIVTAVAAYLYRSNVILVTSEKLSQVLNPALFNRKISQLSIGDVQDVTVHQRGIFPHIFKYGTLVIETAGEQQNYNFTFAPEPYESAKAIVNAHEENLKKYGN